MPSIVSKFAVLAAGLMLAGCMQTAHYEAMNESLLKPRDKEYLAKDRKSTRLNSSHT